MALDRFVADAPDDDAPADARVCLVATRPATFERCREGVYPAPASSDRATEPFDYMAFYRTAPVSAVTHYARVTARVDQRRGEPGPLTTADWETLIDPFSSEDRVVVFELGDLVPLDPPYKTTETAFVARGTVASTTFGRRRRSRRSPSGRGRESTPGEARSRLA